MRFRLTGALFLWLGGAWQAGLKGEVRAESPHRAVISARTLERFDASEQARESGRSAPGLLSNSLPSLGEQEDVVNRE